MTNNPYSVLGISENATDDEVKRAYRELSRKYHPDSYVDNPLKNLAEERFKEVQEAYDTIMRQRSSGYGSSYGGRYQGSGYQNNGYQSHGSQSSYQYGYQNNSSGNSYQYGYQNNGSGAYVDPKYQRVYDFINFRQYSQAMSELNMITLPQRDGRWYYLSAIINAGMGNNIQAQNDINRAISMEPGNQEYRHFASQFQMNSRRYRNNPYNRGPGGTQSCGTGDFCCDLWIADTLCECMGGDLCPCI